jgi:hypothetical protein
VIVIAKEVGRLANRMLLFAHFIGASAEHDFIVVNPAFGTYAHYFPSTARDLLCRFPSGWRVPPFPSGRRRFYRESIRAADALHRRQTSGKDVGLIQLNRDEELDLNSGEFLETVRKHRIVFVRGWFFRNTDNCMRHRDLIRAYFTPFEQHVASARAALEPARKRGRFIVGVHVRRGDYKTFKGGRYYYSHEQYRAVLEKVEAAFPSQDVSFLVCSDASIPADAFAGFDVFYGNGHELEDLYAFAECDRVVGPPSTYTKWASYYGDVPLFVVEDPEETPQADSFLVARGLPRVFPPPAAAPTDGRPRVAAAIGPVPNATVPARVTD